MSSDDAPRIPTRREPPPFRRAVVRTITDLGPRLRRVVLSGPELVGLVVAEPAASVRILLPPVPDADLVMPTWTGNQFELPSGDRAPIRTFTPRAMDHDAGELTVDMVVHESGAAADWVRVAAPGDEVAVSGPGRGYDIDLDAHEYLLAGDETALPAIAQLLEAMPATMGVRVHIEIADPSGRVEMPVHPGATIEWHLLDPGNEPGDTLLAAIAAFETLPGGIWVAGEAAGVQRIRGHLFSERGLDRSAATVRGYWKKGRSAT